MISPDSLDTDKELADQLLTLFANAWVSGYASAAINAAHQVGLSKDRLKAIGLGAEHRAHHSMRHAMQDPASVHTMLETIRHLLGGCEGEQPVMGITTIHHRGRPIQDGS